MKRNFSQTRAQTMSSRLTAIDLFSGCGGLTQGLKDAGFAVVGAVEIDDIAARTYQQNHRTSKLVHKDIRKVTGPLLLKVTGLKRGELDLLAGCPPCQGFSRMRTRNAKRSANDHRNDLVFDFLRLVRSILPRTLMLENVPALRDDRRFKYLTLELKLLGYTLEHAVLDAAKFGVPQRRKRLILVGSRTSAVRLAATNNTTYTVRTAFAQLAQLKDPEDPLHNRRSNHSPRVMEIIRAIPKNGGSRSALPASLRLDCHDAVDGFKDVYGRMCWDTVAPTITGGCFNPSKGRYLHPSLNRAISLREAALLQGFPVNYHFPSDCSMQALALMIGNALPPPFITAHALELRRVLQHEDRQSRNRISNSSQSNRTPSRRRS
jgi:DNA (cytosine-5)-methyltransferase 1